MGVSYEQVHAGIVCSIVVALPEVSGHLTGITHQSSSKSLTVTHFQPSTFLAVYSK